MTRFRQSNSRAAKITPEHVLAIRRAYEAGATQGELSRQYRLGVGQIGRIVRGEAWATLPNAAPGERSQAEMDALMALPITPDEQARIDASQERLLALLAADKPVKSE